MLIIGLTGYAASGKTEIANYLKNSYSFTIIEFSQIIEEEGKKLGLIKEGLSLEEKKRKLSEIGAEIRKKYNNEAIFAEFIVRKILEEKIEKAVVVGFRSLKEVETFRKAFGKNFILVFVYTDAKIRYERRKLQDPSFNYTFEEFLQRDSNDIKNLGLNKMKEASDYLIDNNSSLEDLFRNVDKMLKTIEAKLN
ncbi:MAG: AAA family ATPase [Candidatus Aenigmatarchaeota archaeon]|jgi:dephospho-CoA kinase